MRNSTRIKAIFAFAALVGIAFLVMKVEHQRSREQSDVRHRRANVLARIGMDRRQIVRDCNRNAPRPKELLVRLARIEMRVRNEERVKESFPVLDAAETTVARIEEEIARQDKSPALADLRGRLDRTER